MGWKRATILLVVGIVFLALVLVVRGRLVTPVQERIGVLVSGRVQKSDAEWQAVLTEEQFQVARKRGTERAFSGAYWNTKDDGIFQCVCCGQPVFDTKTKFDSGTGWPSFWQPAEKDNVSLVADNSWLMRRTEVVCSRCDAHLGHVFNDGPPPTGLRYCINSASLKLVKRPGPDEGGTP